MAEVAGPELWNELDRLEQELREREGPLLGRLAPAVAVLHDAPAALVALSASAPDQPHLIVAGEALKRALEDLRALWILLESGHSVAAWAVGADLWEHAMLATCAAGDAEFAAQFTKTEPIERPEPGDLALEAVKLLAVAGDDPERMMQEFSVGYEWLRQLKHKDYPALSRSGVTNADGALPLGATPEPVSDFDDIRMLLAVAFIALRRALAQLASALGIDLAAEGSEWTARLDGAWRIVQETR